MQHNQHCSYKAYVFLVERYFPAESFFHEHDRSEQNLPKCSRDHPASAPAAFPIQTATVYTSTNHFLFIVGLASSDNRQMIVKFCLIPRVEDSENLCFMLHVLYTAIVELYFEKFSARAYRIKFKCCTAALPLDLRRPKGCASECSRLLRPRHRLQRRHTFYST